jgi:hypothetical protein
MRPPGAPPPRRCCALLPLLLLAAHAAAQQPDLPPQCVQYEAEWLPAIHRDLMPWQHTGISAKLLDDTADYGFDRHSVRFLPCRTGQYRVKDGNLSIEFSIAPGAQPDQYGYVYHDCETQFTLGPQTNGIKRLAAKLRLPDTRFVAHVDDHPDNMNTNAPFERELYPFFHFCRTADSADILIPSPVYYFARRDAMGIAYLKQSLVEHPPKPWRERRDVVFGAWSTWGHNDEGQAEGLKRWDEHGQIDYNARGVLERWANASLDHELFQINTQRLPAWQWADFKYLVFVDGVTCR